MPRRVAHVVDVETCGYVNDGPGDVVEVGVTVVVIDDASVTISRPISWLVRPTRQITNMGKATHHIVDSDVAGAPPLSVVMKNLQNIVPAADIYAAHYIGKERRMLPAIAGGNWVCTLKVARRLCPEAQNHQNQFLRYYLGSLDDASSQDRAMATPHHRAGPSSFVTAKNLAKFVDRMSLDAMIDITMNVRPVEFMPFGMHAGARITDVPDKYLKWILQVRDKFDEDVALAARLEVDRRSSLASPTQRPRMVTRQSSLSVQAAAPGGGMP